MMSATEFFDSGPEPPWLVDACGGEVIGVNALLEFFTDANGASSASWAETSAELDQDEGTEAGPSDFAMEMDVDDEVPGPSQNVAVANPLREFEQPPVNVHFVPVDVSLSIESPERQRFAMLSEPQQPWLGTTSARAAMHVPANRFARPAPAAADLFLRAFKKRKFSHIV